MQKNKKASRKATSTKELVCKRALHSVCLIALLVVFVFNFPFWESLTFINQSTLTQTSVGDGLKLVSGQGSDSTGDTSSTGNTANTNTSSNKYEVTNPDTAYIDYEVPDIHLDNIKLDLDNPNYQATSWRNTTGPYIKYSLDIDDASTRVDPLELPEMTYAKGELQSHWDRVHLAGTSKKLRLNLNCEAGTTIEVGDVVVNSVRPFCASLSLVVTLVAIVALFQLLRPSSPLYNIEINRLTTGKLGKKVTICIAVFIVLLGGAFVSKISSSNSVGDSWQVHEVVYDFNQYNHLANALINGSTKLDIPVSQTLNELDNPYDRAARSHALLEAGESYYLDYAYYNGSYYSYFGVLPAIVFFVPYKLITGNDLGTAMAVMIAGCLYILAAHYLILQLLKYLGRRQTLGEYLFALIIFVCCSGFLYLMFLPQLYSLPILCGLALVFFGIAKFLRASRQFDGQSYKILDLCLGSLAIALSILCRPQYFLVILLAIPIFWNGIVKKRHFFSKKGALNTAAIIVPCICVGAVAMAYNYVRFGSFFDFGAAYNLTGLDMTHHPIDMARTIPAVFQYLLQPITIVAQYPFMMESNMAVDYQGLWYTEPYLGGFMWFCPVTFILLGVVSWFKKCENGELKMLVVAMLVLAVIILFADFQIATITTRYFNDFSWLLIVPSLCILWTNKDWEKKSGDLTKVVMTAMFVGVALNVLALFSDGRYAAMVDSCPRIYNAVSSWLFH